MSLYIVNNTFNYIVSMSINNTSELLNKLPNDLIIQVASYSSGSLSLINNDAEIEELNKKLSSVKDFTKKFYLHNHVWRDYTDYYNYTKDKYNEMFINKQEPDYENRINGKENDNYFNDIREVIQLEIIKHNIHLINFIKNPSEIVNKIKNQYNHFRYVLEYYYMRNLYDLHSSTNNDDRYSFDWDLKEPVKEFVKYIMIDRIDDLHSFIQDFIINKNINVIKLFENLPNDLQIRVFNERLAQFSYIKNITCIDELQELDDETLIKKLEECPSNIKYFKNISNDIKSAIIDHIHDEICDAEKYAYYDVSRNHNFSYIPNLNTELQLKIFDFYYKNVQYIKNQTVAFQKIAYRKNPNVLPYLKNPCEDMILKAIEGNPRIFQNFRNTSFKIQKRAVEKCAYNIRNISNPSEELQMLAITINVRVSQYIYNITNKVKQKIKELDIYDVESTQGNYQLENKKKKIINKLTEEEQIKAIDLNPNVFKLIDDPSYTIQKFAVERWSYNIQHIKKQSDELQLLAMNWDPETYKFINDPCIDVCNIARKYDVKSKRGYY